MARPKEFDHLQALQRALDTFWERGYDATAVRDLCAAMALNSGSLYGAFGDKRALFLAALDHYVETESRQAGERITSAPSGLLGIESFFDYLLDQMLQGKRRWGCLVTNSVTELASRDPEVAARARQQLQRLEKSFAGALERARVAGEVGPHVGPETASFLVCVVQGLNVLAKTGPSRKALERVVAVALGSIAVATARRKVTAASAPTP